jgi:hypothetical protein
MTKKQNLQIQKEHLKDSAEKHRVRLAALWDHGKQNTWLFKKLHEQRELMMIKIDRIDDELCPMQYSKIFKPKTNKYEKEILQLLIPF